MPDLNDDDLDELLLYLTPRARRREPPRRRAARANLARGCL